MELTQSWRPWRWCAVYLKATLASASRQLTTLAQGVMSRQHLASQAPPGSPVLRQLGAMSALNACIRTRQPRLASEMRIGEDLLPLPRDGPGTKLLTALSPAHDCAFIGWVGGNMEDDYCGITMVGRDQAGALCTYPHPSDDDGEDDAISYGQSIAGWSPCGRYCVVLLEVKQLVVCTFDAHLRCWGQPKSFPGVCLCDFDESSIVFSAVGGVLLAASCCQPFINSERHTLLVVKLPEQTIQVVPCARLERFQWLPGSHELLLLQQCFLARVKALTWSAHTPLSWVPTGVTDDDLRAAMALSPDSGSVWVAAALDRKQRHCHVSVHSSSDLACQGCWQVRVLGKADDSGWVEDVQVTSRALALCLRRHSGLTVSVFALTGPHTLGGLCFRDAGLGSLLYSPGGGEGVGVALSAGGSAFMLGLQDHKTAKLLDARTGSTLSSALDSSDSLSRIHSVSWCSDPSQVLVTSSSSEGLLFRVLAF